MNDSFAPAAATPGHVARTSSSHWARWLVVLAIFGLALMAGLALLSQTMHLGGPLHLSIDGQDFVHEFSTDAMQPLDKLMLAGAVLIALLVAAVVVPLALAFTVLMVALVVVAAVGLPMVAVVAAAALLLSPLLLLLWLFWKMIAP
jgi:hypothetical protein